jgi:hypothetical protein
VETSLAIFMCDGPKEETVARSLSDVEGDVETYDAYRLDFFAGDGTVIETTVDHDRVVRNGTEEKSPGQLRQGPQAYLQQPSGALDPGLADDIPALIAGDPRSSGSCSLAPVAQWLNHLLHGNAAPG